MPVNGRPVVRAHTETEAGAGPGTGAETQKTAETQSLPDNVPPEQKKTKISILRPPDSANSLIPNLNDLEANYSKREEEKTKYIDGDGKAAFDSDAMLKYWNQYAEKIKKAGKINIFTVMTANTPRLLPDHIIELAIENKIQDDLLSHEKVDLLNYLRLSLKNFSIDLVTKQIEQASKKRLYTSQEKYQHMLEKNPALEEFKRRFNLDLDY